MAVLQPILIEQIDHVFMNTSIYIFKVFSSRAGLNYFLGCRHEPMAYGYGALNLWRDWLDSCCSTPQLVPYFFLGSRLPLWFLSLDFYVSASCKTARPGLGVSFFLSIVKVILAPIGGGFGLNEAKVSVTPVSVNSSI